MNLLRLELKVLGHLCFCHHTCFLPPHLPPPPHCKILNLTPFTHSLLSP